MSEDILKIMEAIREEARAEDAPALDIIRDTEKRTGFKAGDLSWQPPTPKEQEPVTGTGTANDPYVLGRGAIIRVKKRGAQEGDAPAYEGTIADLLSKAGAAIGNEGAQTDSDIFKQGLLNPDIGAIDLLAPGGRGELPEEPASWKQQPVTGTQKTRQVGTVAAPSDTTEPAADDAAGLNPGQFLRRGVRVSPPPLDTDVSRPPKDIMVGHKYHDDD